MSYTTGVLLLAIVTALAASLPGVFVVLRRESMLVDAIAHAVFPGIVVGFYFTHDLDSPLLVAGAALAGLAVVLGSDWLTRTRLVTGDAPQGLLFPALFSGGVILVTSDFAHIHLDVHAVLVGDLNLAAFKHVFVNGQSIGPEYLYVMLGVLAINAIAIALLLPRLKVATFDSEFARVAGLRTGMLGTVFMFLVAVTVTAAFNAAGAILILALVVIPAAVAALLTKRLGSMILVTLLVAGLGAWAGFEMAYSLNVATSAGMSVFYGVIFAIAFGSVQVRNWWRRRRLHGQLGQEETAQAAGAAGAGAAGAGAAAVARAARA
ncbi:metal ABC transporter permease [Buchananella felis]|uniref:metal ABC transporter permease n=1 Tax=Buchananella felis TaxID=3231492 RepID=UPI003528027F